MRKIIYILTLLVPLIASGQHHMMHPLASQGSIELLSSDVDFWLSLDEISGTIAYDCCNDLNFDNSLVATGTTGKLGTAYTFNSDEDNLYTSSLSGSSSPFSISFWVKIHESDYEGINVMTNYPITGYIGMDIHCEYNNISVALGDGAGFYSSNRKIFYYTASELSYETWVQVTVVYTSFSDFKVYVNGNLKTLSYTSGTGTSVAWNQGYFHVLSGGSSYVSIDELVLFNKAITSGNVAWLYNSGNGRGCPYASSSPPTVTTTSITNIGAFSASSGGNVTSSGGSAVTARGVCWSTSQNPTTANNKTIDGTGTGSFSSSVYGGTCGTTYYVRAYATNSSGTAYGSQVSFTTTSSNLSEWNIFYAVWQIDCSGNAISIVSEQAAKDAINLIRNPVNGCGNLQSNGYVYKADALSVGSQLFSYTDCTIPPSEQRNSWRVFGNLIGSTFYVVHIDSNGVIDIFYSY